MRVVLKGIHRVKRRLADGSYREHIYAWRGGPRIDAREGTLDFLAAFAEATQLRRQERAGALSGLIEEFIGSTDFSGLSASSQRAYRAYTAAIEREFGDMSLAALQDPEARGEFKAWRDTLAAKPRTADYAWTVLARVLSFGKDRGRIAVNVCERGGRLYRADRGDLIWTAEHIDRFVAAASPELHLALVLALWTGQRQADLLTLGWSRFDGDRIRLRQSKTGSRVTIPAGTTLKDTLKQAPRRATTILTNSDGSPWTSDGFRSCWRKACNRAEIHDVTFHDLRGTAVVRLALAGCEVPEIAAITGHSPTHATEILGLHYLRRDVRLAEAAMRKREQNERRTKL